jgi:hypothetical protein
LIRKPSSVTNEYLPQSTGTHHIGVVREEAILWLPSNLQSIAWNCSMDALKRIALEAEYAKSNPSTCTTNSIDLSNLADNFEANLNKLFEEQKAMFEFIEQMQDESNIDNEEMNVEEAESFQRQASAKYWENESFESLECFHDLCRFKDKAVSLLILFLLKFM